jgi:hypothetical protein
MASRAVSEPAHDIQQLHEIRHQSHLFFMSPIDGAVIPADVRRIGAPATAFAQNSVTANLQLAVTTRCNLACTS